MINFVNKYVQEIRYFILFAAIALILNKCVFKTRAASFFLIYEKVTNSALLQLLRTKEQVDWIALFTYNFSQMKASVYKPWTAMRMLHTHVTHSLTQQPCVRCEAFKFLQRKTVDH